MIKNYLSLVFVIALLGGDLIAQTTSWTGTVSTQWNNSSNWTAGVPNSSTDAIIGDVSFTGSFQPVLNGSTARCLNLTVGNGAIASTLTIAKNIVIYSDILIGANGTIDASSNSRSMTIEGDWTNNGTYSATTTSALVTFSGTNQMLIGSTNFEKIKINSSSSVTLADNIVCGTEIMIYGTLDPTDSYSVSGTGNLILQSGGDLLVHTSNFTGNYPISGTISLHKYSYVNYASSSITQYVSSAFSYGRLRISGGSTKELTADLPDLQSSNSNTGRIYIDAGILDLKTFTANRGTSSTGGSFIIYSGASLKIGGVNEFPSNYSYMSLNSTSTVEYNGNNQNVIDLNYGNLIFEGTSGSVVKTMPNTELKIYGNFTANIGNATSLSFTAMSNIDFKQDFYTGTNTTFNGGSFIHTFRGDWANYGSYTGSTSMCYFRGIGASISGTGTNNFYDLKFRASGITAEGTTDINVASHISAGYGGVFVHNSGGTITMTGTSKTIYGDELTFNNLVITGTITSSKEFRVNGDFTSNGSFIGSSGNIIYLNGANKTILGTGFISFYRLYVNGTISTVRDFTMRRDLAVASFGSFIATNGVATFDNYTTLTGRADLYDLIINSGKTLRVGVNSILGIANVFTRIGNLSMTATSPNLVEYNGAGNQNVIPENYYDLTFANGGVKTTVGDVDVRNNITINSGVELDASSNTIEVYSDWINNGTFTASTSDVVFKSTPISNIFGATTFNDFTINKSSSSTYTYLKDNITANNIIMTRGILDTETDTITTLGGRSGPGIIHGTIAHNHAFTGGTNYFFEGPYNSINFTTPSAGLTSVIVTIIPDEVTDFDPSIECIEREYEIDIPNGTYTNATVRYHYEDVDLSAFEEPYLMIYKHNTGIVWDSVGFTSRNTSLNWVEYSGLTSISGRYAFSGIRSIVEWNGSVSDEWEDFDNWTTVSGSNMTDRVPTAQDAARIGTSAFTNQPTIYDNQSIAALRFGSVQPVVLTLDNSLEIISSAKGTWSTNQTHTIEVGSNQFVVNSNLHLSDGTIGNDIDINASTGSISVENNILHKGGSAITFTDAGDLTIYGNYIYTSGTFTPATSTVTYTGEINQVVAPITYYNLAFTKVNEKAMINSVATVNGNLETSIGGEVEINDTLTVKGNITIGASTILKENNANVYLDGNWVTNGTFVPGNGHVHFVGTAAQSVNSTLFNDVIVNKVSGVLSLVDSISISNNFTITDGTVDLGAFKADRTINGGALTLDAGAILQVGGVDNFPFNFSVNTVNATSTVEFDGTMEQNVLEAISYGNLILSNGGANVKTILGNIQVDGDLLINSGATLSADSVNISIYGNLTNSGTITPGESTLLLEGTSKTITGPLTLNNIIANGSYSVTSGTTTMLGNLYVETTGDLNFGNNDAILDGDLTNKGVLTSTASATFTGTRVQTFQLTNAISSSSTGVINFNGTVSPVLNSTSSPSFATVNINNTAGITASLPWNVFFACNIANGSSFDDGGFTHNFYGDFTNSGDVISSGNLIFSPGAPYSANGTVTLDGSSFTSTGNVTFGGNVPLTIVDVAPTFHNVTISNTFGSGITAPGSWNIENELQILNGATFNAGSATTHTIVNGLLNNGTLLGETSTVVFTADTAQIDGIGTTSFNNLTISSGTELIINKDINVGENLVNNGSFTGYGRKVAFIGTTASVISGTAGSITISDFEQNKTGTITTLSIPVTVTDSLYLTDGIVNTDATNLMILNDDAVSAPGNVTSFIDGPMKKIGDDAFIFPLGDGTEWARLGISAPAVATDAFTAQYTGAAYIDVITMAGSPTPVLTNVSQGEYWNCDRSNGSSNVTVQLFWENATQSGIDDYSTDLVVARWNGSAWENAGQSAINAASPGSVTSNTVTAFSPFTFGSLSLLGNPLPIELISFDAVLEEQVVHLTWETATEINNDYFTVERTNDGKNYEEVGETKGAGNSTSILRYSMIDDNPLEGISYYRLKQTDFNGEYSYSDVVSVFKTVSTISVYPNPNKGELIHLSINETKENMTVEIRDIRGVIVFTKYYQELTNEIMIRPDQHLNPGIYFISLTDNKIKLSEKLIVN